MVKVSKVKGVRVKTVADRADSDRVQVVQVKRPQRAVRWHVSRVATRETK